MWDDGSDCEGGGFGCTPLGVPAGVTWRGGIGLGGFPPHGDGALGRPELRGPSVHGRKEPNPSSPLLGFLAGRDLINPGRRHFAESGIPRNLRNRSGCGWMTRRKGRGRGIFEGMQAYIVREAADSFPLPCCDSRSVFSDREFFCVEPFHVGGCYRWKGGHRHETVQN